MIPKRKTESLLRKNKIKDRVMIRWNRQTNPNCKFVPGDSVMIRNRLSNRHGIYGRVIAVTTVDGERICDNKRKNSSYYVYDGELVYPVLSYHLVSAV